MKIKQLRGPYVLRDEEDKPYLSFVPGKLGGYRREKYKLYGTLKCKRALHSLAAPNSKYEEHRVFFAEAWIAEAAGYRPCAVCLPLCYAEWKGRSGK